MINIQTDTQTHTRNNICTIRGRMRERANITNEKMEDEKEVRVATEMILEDKKKYKRWGR